MSKSSLAMVAQWAFGDIAHLEELLAARNKDAVRKIFPDLPEGDVDEVWDILNNRNIPDSGNPHSTTVNGRPILDELHRLWLYVPEHSPRPAAKVDPWKGYT